MPTSPSSSPHDTTLRAAFFDIDGTLTSDRTWKGFIAYFKTHKQRRFTHIAFLMRHYPLYFLYRLELVSADTFRGVWAANMAWYVRGYTVAQAAAVWDWIVEHFINQHWRTDIRTLLQGHLDAGEKVVLVSSGPLPLNQRIARELGVKHAVGTVLEIENGRYTGRSLRPICIGEHKAAIARGYLADRGFRVDLQASHTYADSVTDLALLEMVGHPLAVYPQENLRRIAEARGWEIFPG